MAHPLLIDSSFAVLQGPGAEISRAYVAGMKKEFLENVTKMNSVLQQSITELTLNSMESFKCVSRSVLSHRSSYLFFLFVAQASDHDTNHHICTGTPFHHPPSPCGIHLHNESHNVQIHFSTLHRSSQY